MIEGKDEKAVVDPDHHEIYTVESALEGLFIDREQFSRILDSIQLRKNLILQGPPGTGKTFIALRIAWCLIGRKDRTSWERCSREV